MKTLTHKKYKIALNDERQILINGESTRTRPVPINQHDRRILALSKPDNQTAHNSLNESDECTISEVVTTPTNKLPTRSVPVQIPVSKPISLSKVLPDSDWPTISDVVPIPMKKLPIPTRSVQNPIPVPKPISLTEVPSEYGENKSCRSCRNPCEDDPMLIFDNTRVAGEEFKIVQLIENCIGLKVKKKLFSILRS